MHSSDDHGFIQARTSYHYTVYHIHVHTRTTAAYIKATYSQSYTHMYMYVHQGYVYIYMYKDTYLYHTKINLLYMSMYVVILIAT